MIYESMKEVSLFIFISKMKMKFTKLDNFKSLLKVQEKKKKKKKKKKKLNKKENGNPPTILWLNTVKIVLNNMKIKNIYNLVKKKKILKNKIQFLVDECFAIIETIKEILTKYEGKYKIYKE